MTISSNNWPPNIRISTITPRSAGRRVRTGGGDSTCITISMNKWIFSARYFPIPRTLLYICGLAGMQSGLFQVMARHSLGGGYFTLRKTLANVDPNDWQLSQVRRGVRATPRCMVEVY